MNAHKMSSSASYKKAFLKRCVFKSVLNTCNYIAFLREGVKLFHRTAEQTVKRRSPCVTVSEVGTNKSAGSEADRIEFC